MTSAAQLPSDTAALISHYEKIRGEALRRPGRSGRGNGLALFLRRGMAGWIAACAPLVRALEAPPSKPAEEGRLPLDLRSEVATVLTEMALTVVHNRGVSTCSPMPIRR